MSSNSPAPKGKIAAGKTEVRIQLLRDETIKVTRKGIEICNSVVTWAWLDRARAEVLGPDASAPVPAPKAKAKPKSRSKTKAPGLVATAPKSK